MSERRKLPIEIKNPGRLLTYTYVISLSVIAVLSIAVHVMLDRVIAQQSETGRIVNISGQQRMLSQRTSLFTVEYLTTGNADAKRLASQSLALMLQNHTTLLTEHRAALERGRASPLSATLQAMYFSEPTDVDGKLNTFSRQVKAALGDQTPQEKDDIATYSMAFLDLARQPLLSALHAVVEQYERESVEKVNDLRFAQNVVLGIIIFTILVEALFIFRPMVAKISRFALQLQYDANFDHLSGILNRRAFNLIAKQAVASAKRYGRPLSVVIFDIDLFKNINDTFGHAAGDLAIKCTAQLLQHHCREADVVARIGGEEFVLLLPDTDAQGALAVAEKMRVQIEKNFIEFEQQSITFTASAGVAQLAQDHEGIEQPLHLADEALYRSKQAGRNRVTTG